MLATGVTYHGSRHQQQEHRLAHHLERNGSGAAAAGARQRIGPVRGKANLGLGVAQALMRSRTHVFLTRVHQCPWLARDKFPGRPEVMAFP